MSELLVTLGAGTEPSDLKLTTHLSRHRLQEESPSWKKTNLLLIPNGLHPEVGPFFFYQILNHRTPGGILY